jgi:rhamnulokinase
MNRYFVACHLGPGKGRVSLGTLSKTSLNVSEVAHFPNTPIEAEDSLHWDIPQLYHEMLQALTALGAYEEPVDSISCVSWGGDYLLFGSDGSLVSPTFHYADPRGELGLQKVLGKIPLETLYEHTGIQPAPSHTLFQLATEKSRRLRHAKHLLSIADGFNFLLCGVPHIEISQAGATQLLNPVTREWAKEVCDVANLPAGLLPPIVPAGTVLGPLRAELTKHPGLEEARLIASCSHEGPAALAPLPLHTGGGWAFLRQGQWSVLGTGVNEPIINISARDTGISNELGYGSVHVHKHAMGLWMLNECRRFWEQKGCGLDDEMLNHLAGSAPPFESLINPADPRFLEPGDMPMKIQAFCKETYQPIPRKPGAIIRCILESLAFLYRKMLRDIEAVTGVEITRVYVLGNSPNGLLNHFTANALRIPVIVLPPEMPSIGSIMIQALALGHIKTLEEARELVRLCIKPDTINPHASACQAAYDRLEQLLPEGAVQSQ